MSDEFFRPVLFGRHRDDFDCVSAGGIVFVERFDIGFRHIFERLSPLVSRRDKRAFEMHAQKSGAFLVVFFAVFSDGLHGFENIFLALRHRRGEEGSRSFRGDRLRDRFKRLRTSVHGIGAARAVDMFVDKAGQDDGIFGQRNDVALSERPADALYSFVKYQIDLFQAFALDVHESIFKRFCHFPILLVSFQLFPSKERSSRLVAHERAVGVEL